MTPAEIQLLQQMMLGCLHSAMKKKGISEQEAGASRAYDIVANYLLKGDALDFVVGHVLQEAFHGRFDPDNEQHLQRYVHCCMDIALLMMIDCRGKVKPWLKHACQEAGQSLDEPCDDKIKNALLSAFLFQGAQTGPAKKYHFSKQDAARCFLMEMCNESLGANGRKLTQQDSLETPPVKSITRILRESHDRKKHKLEQNGVTSQQGVNRLRKKAQIPFDKFERDQAFVMKHIDRPTADDRREMRSWIFQYTDNYRKLVRYIDGIGEPALTREFMDKLEDPDKDYYINNLQFKEVYDYYMNNVVHDQPQYFRNAIVEHDRLCAIIHRVMRDIGEGKVDLAEARKVVMKVDEFNKKIIQFSNPKLQALLIDDAKERRFSGLAPDSLSLRTLLARRSMKEDLNLDGLLGELSNVSLLINDHLEDLRWLTADNKIADLDIFHSVEDMVNSEYYGVRDKILPALNDHADKLRQLDKSAKHDPELQREVQGRMQRVSLLRGSFERNEMRLHLLRLACAYHEYQYNSHLPSEIRPAKEDRMLRIGLDCTLDEYDEEVQQRYSEHEATEELQEDFLNAAYEQQDINPYCRKYSGAGAKMRNKVSMKVRDRWLAPQKLILDELVTMADEDAEYDQSVGEEMLGWEKDMLIDEKLNYEMELSGYDDMQRVHVKETPLANEINTCVKVNDSMSTMYANAYPPARRRLMRRHEISVDENKWKRKQKELFELDKKHSRT